MLDAVVYCLFVNLVECVFCFYLAVEGLYVSKLLEPLTVEDAFHLTEDQLDGVVLWRVCQVEDGLDIQTAVGCLSGQCLVDAKVIHEDGERRLAIREAEPVQELDELPLVEGLLLYCKGFHACLFADGGAHTDVPLVDLVLVDADVSALAAPLLFADAQLGEVDLV